jgi:antitoxin component YwqK of YwqJK toxin-antitoxin module
MIHTLIRETIPLFFIYLFLFLLYYFLAPSKIYRLNPGITWNGGVYLYYGVPYSGVLWEGFPEDNSFREMNLKNGIHEGTVIDYYRTGGIALEKYFLNNLHEGTHKKYFQNGNLAFVGEFSQGEPIGVHKEFYISGQPYDFKVYQNGELLSHKIWRKTGQIWVNYIYTPNRTYGLKGAKLCRKVSGDTKGNTKSY